MRYETEIAVEFVIWIKKEKVLKIWNRDKQARLRTFGLLMQEQVSKECRFKVSPACDGVIVLK